MKTKSTHKKQRPARTAKKTHAIHLQRILVPIDFSDPSKQALRYAVSFAKHFNAELLLVYVAEPAVYPPDFSFGQVGIPNLEREMRERGEQELQRLIKKHVAGQVPVRSLICTGKPFLEINETAKQENVDLIIIATHGQTGVEHMLFGGTAEKVVRRAPCPVLVVRSQEREFIKKG